MQLASGAGTEIVTCLRNGALRELFIEHLGWDRAHGLLAIDVDSEQLTLEEIAHKRGFLVVRLTADRIRGQTKRFVRDVQARVTRLSHEHLLIVQGERSDVQVWAWAYRDLSNGRLRHRFHPLFTDRIPPKLVQRIQRLSVSLDEEERITLFDIVDRTKESLNVEADQAVFFRRPRYTQRSHELALKMRAGGKKEFDDFVIFHRKLATWFARRYKRMVSDGEDMAQEAMAGLIRSARKYDTDRGTAFSTYAFAAMRNECHRALPRLVPVGRVPDYLYWPFRRVLRRWDRATRIGGYDAGLDARDHAIAEEGLDLAASVDLYRFFRPTTLDGENRSEWVDAVGAVDYTHRDRDCDGYRNPLTDVAQKEMREILMRAVAALPQRDAAIILARVGLGTQGMTLQELGDKLGLTRERVRQVEKKALGQLRGWLGREYPGEFPFSTEESEDSETPDVGTKDDEEQK